MLDDLKLIHQRDMQDALGAVEKQAVQLRQVFAVPPVPQAVRHVAQVVCLGMSTSVYGAELARTWTEPGVPLEVVRGYEVPAYVGGQTLCIACSFSGSTEETIAAVEQAAQAGAIIVVITAGGQLAAWAQERGYAWVALPAQGQSRFAVWHMLGAVTAVLDTYGVTQGCNAALAAQADWLGQQVQAWRPDVPASRNHAKHIAQELMGKSVVVYAGPKLAPVAYRWKTSINENAKQLAWCGQYPEFNHNEFVSWSKQPVRKPYAVVELQSNLEHERVRQRFAVSQKLLSGMRPAPIVVQPQGDTLLQQLLYASVLGDFVSVYLAILNNIDPSALTLVDALKKELG